MLLTHGDLLCTDDVRYQTLRTQLRAAAWQRDFLAKPLAERRAIAAEFAEAECARSRRSARKSWTSINDSRRHDGAHGVRCLLHGHTHRPGVHRFELDGEAATRIVLGLGTSKRVSCAGTRPGFDSKRYPIASRRPTRDRRAARGPTDNAPSARPRASDRDTAADALDREPERGRDACACR